jgi:hypothetical protein
MKYKCIKSFDVPKFDGDGEETDEWITVEDGSIWELNDDDGTIISADHHLDSVSDNYSNWLEIGDECLKENFIEVTANA